MKRYEYHRTRLVDGRPSKYEWTAFQSEWSEAKNGFVRGETPIAIVKRCRLGRHWNTWEARRLDDHYKALGATRDEAVNRAMSRR